MEIYIFSESNKLTMTFKIKILVVKDPEKWVLLYIVGFNFLYLRRLI